MAKLTTVRIKLIILQLISLIIASVIIIINYNPWISRFIDEVERSGNTGRSLADQIRRTDNEELVIFLMSSSTILVSLLGIIGSFRNHDHNHCLLNFYMSTLIIFLFVVFVALCGTIWEVFAKLHRSTLMSLPEEDSQVHNAESNRNIYEDDSWSTRSSISVNITPLINTKSHLVVSWLYIGKSLMLITISAFIYAVSLKLVRKILESSDDQYLSASECVADPDDLSLEEGGGDISYANSGSKTFKNLSRYPCNFNCNSHIIDIYSGNMIGSSSKTSLGSQFRTIT